MLAIQVRSQTPAAQKSALEVTSVKRNASGANGGTTLGSRGNGYYAPNVTLRILVHSAYADPRGLLLPNQIVGGPDWMDTDRFDVQARMQGDPAAIPPRQRQLMLQSLLEDRFQLKAQRETRDWPVYNLIVAKGGPKMKLAEDQRIRVLADLPLDSCRTKCPEVTIPHCRYISLTRRGLLFGDSTLEWLCLNWTCGRVVPLRTCG
jgi:uncharacterized protein (TIGR03435 family)